MRRNLALLGCSLMLVALLSELALRLFFPPPPTWRIPQIHHLKSPLLGWVLPPDTQAFTIDAPVSINPLGLRDDPFRLDKPPGETRILALGDSFTFALGVRFEELWVQQLERLLNENHRHRRFQVINAAVAGYNTRQELIYLLTEGLELDPDLVIVAFYWNDLVGNEEPLPDLAPTPKLSSTPRARDPGTGHWIPAPVRNTLRQSVLLYQVVTRTKALMSRLDPPEDRYFPVQQALLTGDEQLLKPHWQATERRLLQIAEAARQAGIVAMLAFFPMENQIRHPYPDLELAERLHAIWRATEMPFVNLEPAYRSALDAGENPFLPYDLHPGPLGMRVAAERLYAAIREHDLLPLGEGPGDGR